ncbi:hypothetical protein ACW6AV_002208 [Edwardsiella piscicida]|uniref:hypothetical protein n=1 Tax=Edwardsiella piscicida TaxID=1263550 RepID=UPI00054CC95B|nr:hypothetical protein [Edwardsiella piscicida]ELM3658872.1 hypothetical protein [Edwardsiella piscicida]ELM3736825.1 hypothetical protein [Edwardsiella piscicida]QBB12107.1 hypothetical protein EVK84_05845 [Edwardsiella piscicida]UCQ14989.1 hypothetical protein DCE53_01460 [Edwardsiella piscicida]UCQ38176.1 hypothetical protein DCF36_01440 [Edwardsiella piscicida]
MYWLGLLFYILSGLSYVAFPAVKNMVNQALLLAPQISYACAVLFIYPLAIFLCHLIFRMKSKKYYLLLATQTKLAASIAVSLGLIGTFIGLTDMILAISSSLGGDGNLATKMNAMISSISTALGAMSYAFLTSIVGVSISVLLLISLSFWAFYYKSEKEDDSKPERERSLELQELLKRISVIESVNVNIANKLIAIPENTQLTEMLAKNSADMVMHLGKIEEGLQTIGHSIKKVGEENIEKSSHMLEILSGIEGNGISTGNKLERCIERLSEFNIQMNVQRIMFKEHFENVCDSGISNAKSINEMLAAQATQTNLFKEHFEFVQKMSHANHEQLKNIIDSQANYINEQGRFKNKLKDVLKVIANEN